MTRIRFVLFAALLAVGGASFAAQEPPRKPDEMPQDEQKLVEWSQQHMNRGQWQQADRGYKEYLKKFPEGKQAEHVHQQLGYVHLWYSRRHAEAREWFQKLCEKYPKSPNYWQYRFQVGDSYVQQQLRDQAVEEFRKIAKEATEPSMRANAIQRAWGVQGKHFSMSVNQTFTAGQEPVVHVQLQKIDKVKYRATYIKYDHLLEHVSGADAGNLLQAIAKVDAKGRAVVKEWDADYAYARDREWRQEQVRIPATASGVYILEGEHEKVTMTVTLFVSKYGLVTKSAAGKLLVFAQDRATSKPVEGVAIRVLHGEKPLTGTTGADGLFVAENYKGGVVLGTKDGELITTQTYYSERQGAHPLIYITTDRPIYRPNQTVNFRVLHRIENGQSLEVKPGEKMVVEIRDTKGNKVYEKALALGAFGSAEGSFVLGDEPALGEYTILTRTEQDAPELHQHDWRWQRFHGNGPHNFMKFRVDEYRKPEYKVDVTFKRSPVLQGDTVDATVLAKYYFGSPVVDAEVKYTVHRRPHWYSWRSWDFYYDWYVDEEEEGIYAAKRGRAWWGPGEQVMQGAGKTDKDGKLPVVFPAQKWEHDAVYTVVAQVTDLSRRTVDGSGTCKATRAEFGLAMSLNKYVYKPGDKINVRVRAAKADDTVVPDQKIVVKAYDRRWANGKHEDSFLFEAESRTDRTGVADFNLSSDREGGYLWITAEAKDGKGNDVTAGHYAWLCGNNWGGDTVNLNGIDLVPDKKTYTLGDTAQLLVTSQFKNVTLLLTVEGKEIHRHEVIQVKGHTKMVELKIDDPVFAPNVFVGLIAIKENQVVQRQKMLIVNPSHKFVKVEVTPDKAQYRPRQKAVYEVKTTGADGKPVAAEVAVGIVDDSIYALQDEYAPDIRKHFIHRKGVEVATSTSLYYHDWGHAEEKQQGAAKPAAAGAPMHQGFGALREEAGGEGLRKNRNALKDGRGGEAGEYAATEVRSNFADTMLWRAVTTDAAGRAKVEVDIPDNLTTWKATARAATADSRFGQETNSVVARKEMIVRLETPRFFTQNDETVVSAVAHNYLESEKEVKIEFAAEGIEVAGEKELKVRIEAGGQKRIDWKARVRSAGSAKITVKALSDADSDAMQLTIPVLAHGTMRWESDAGIVDGKVTRKVTIPAGRAKDAAEMVVSVAPTHAAMVLDALDYLAGYPYGCVEQTMSRFLPTVVVSKALQKLGLRKPELEKELPAMVAAGLQRLYNFQQPDGGWGWWQHDKSNPWTTAYVVFGLSMARDADHAVEPAVLSRGIAALRSHLASAKEADQQAYLLYALSAAGVRVDDVRSQLTDKLGELKPYSKALLALVLSKDGRDAKFVVESIAKDAKVVGGSVHFEGGTNGGWMDHQMEVTAAVLRAFLKVEPKHELVPRMVHWLSVVRQGNYWGSTKQTAMVVFSLVEYLAHTGDLNPDMTITLTVNGERIFSERVTKDNWHEFEGMRKFKAAKLREGENEVVIEKTGNGNPIWSIYTKTYAEQEDLQPSKGGIQVERIYSKVINEGGKRILQRLESGAEVASGDEIEVMITVSADRNYEWLMMDDPMPSGFEAVREHWGHYGWGRWSYWYSRKEFRDEKVSIAMSTLWQGRHQAAYVMRAETPGDFHVLPTQVFNMYHPEIGGNGAEFRIKVVDKK
jgi:hypothetical protein